MSPKKRPAAAVASEAGPCKRPASNHKGEINNFIEDATNPKSEKAEVEDETHRHKGKAEKFAKLLKAGVLPPHIAHMWTVESKKQPSTRQYQTQLINKLMKKQADGSYALDCEQNFFEEYRQVFTEQKAKDSQKGMPRNVFLHTHFHGNEAALKESITSGEVTSSKDPDTGIEFLSFRVLKLTESKVNRSGETVKGTKKVKGEEAKVMAGLMSQLKWQWALKEARVQVFSSRNVFKVLLNYC